MKIQACLFDLDGTLIDSAGDLASSVNHVRSHFNMPALPVAIVESYVGDGLTMLLQRSLETKDPHRIAEAAALYAPHYEAHCLDQTRLYPGVKEMLEAAAKAKVSMAVVSNKPEIYCRKILAGLSVDAHFPVVLGGDTLPQRKPDPAPFHRACRDLGVSGPTLVVGDSINDIEGARRAHYASCGVLWGLGEKELVRRARPDHLIQRPEELIPILTD